MTHTSEIHIALGLVAISVAAYLLKTRHKHTWKLIKDISLYDENDLETPTGHKYISQCTTCGKLKSERL